MIDLNKKYTTKNGYPVFLYDIVGNKVFGRLFRDEQWYSSEWSLQDGEDLYYGGSSLVEVPEFSIISHNIKKVKYLGIELTVPTWTKWICVNALGEIRLFDDVPEYSETLWIKRIQLGNVGYLPVNIGYTGDWKKSLRQV